MGVSAFCMLRKCRSPGLVTSPSGRCDGVGCDCSCHDQPETYGTQAEGEVSERVLAIRAARAEREAREASDDGAVIERARPVLERIEAKIDIDNFETFPGPNASGPCPIVGCGREVRLVGPGRASHLRWHANRGEYLPGDEPPPAPSDEWGPDLGPPAAFRSVTPPPAPEENPEPPATISPALDIEIPVEQAVDNDGRIWNVVAPAGSDVAVAEAAARVLRDNPNLSGRPLSMAIAMLVPGARPGADLPVPVIPAEEPAAEDEPEPDVLLWLSPLDRALLELLVDASTVWNDVGDAVMGLLRFGLDMARDELSWGLNETLRYNGGMTAEEQDAHDERERAARS